METKFPLESDLGKYFVYELYLRTKPDTKKQLENAVIFQKCLNLNRVSLRTLNCGERKKNLDNFIAENSEDFSEFKEKVSEECNTSISKYLSSKFSQETATDDISLYQRFNNEVMIDANFNEVNECLKL